MLDSATQRSAQQDFIHEKTEDIFWKYVETEQSLIIHQKYSLKGN